MTIITSKTKYFIKRKARTKIFNYSHKHKSEQYHDEYHKHKHGHLHHVDEGYLVTN